MGEIFPPHTKCTRTRGRPFWGGSVYSGGCLSNLMNAYWKYLFLIQNITWISTGFYITSISNESIESIKIALSYDWLGLWADFVTHKRFKFSKWQTTERKWVSIFRHMYIDRMNRPKQVWTELKSFLVSLFTQTKKKRTFAQPQQETL